MKVLWLSRHAPTNEQLSELERIFNGKFDGAEQVSVTISKGEEVAQLMKAYGCREVVAVLPIDLIQQVTDLGIKPLRAVMERKFDNYGNARFLFSHFERVEKIVAETKRL
jgi:hypothetical protein